MKQEAPPSTGWSSSLIYAYPEMVRNYNLPKYFPTTKSRLGNFLRFLKSEELAVTVDWVSDPRNPYYLGDPSKADAQRGKQMIEFHVKKSVELFEQALNSQYCPPKLYNAIVRLLLRIL